MIKVSTFIYLKFFIKLISMKKMKYMDAKKLLESYDINVVQSMHVNEERQAVSKAEEIGLPVVMKVDSPEIIHKSDKGYVKTDLDSKDKVKRAFKEMKDKADAENADFHGVILQDQIKGKEVIIGGKIDPQFGPVVLFGYGGIFVEVFEDISLRVAPVTEEETRRMMKEIRAYPLLTGIRGEEPVALDKLTHFITRVADLMNEHPEIKEMDLNPTMVNPENVYAVDLRIFVQEEE